MQIKKSDIKFIKTLTKRKKTTEIIIHCTATTEGKEYSVQSIHKDHLKNGWAGIGYNYVIDLQGNIWEGRPEDKVGAHCKNHNSKSIGISYVGGIGKDKKAKDTRNESQLKAMEDLCRYLHGKYPEATFHGHREFENKACPCFDVGEWIETLDLDRISETAADETLKKAETVTSKEEKTDTPETSTEEVKKEVGFLSAIIEFLKALFGGKA